MATVGVKRYKHDELRRKAVIVSSDDVVRHNGHERCTRPRHYDASDVRVHKALSAIRASRHGARRQICAVLVTVLSTLSQACTLFSMRFSIIFRSRVVSTPAIFTDNTQFLAVINTIS